MKKRLIKELSQLNRKEKLHLVEEIWDSIASNPEEVEVPDQHKTILEKRLQTLEEDKENSSTWNEVRQKYL